MGIEDSNQQSTTGKVASGYLQVTGHTNVVGAIFVFILGGLAILAGVILTLISGNFFLLIFSVVGIGLIFLGRFILRMSKKMREGKYYQVGDGWVKPE